MQMPCGEMSGFATASGSCNWVGHVLDVDFILLSSGRTARWRTGEGAGTCCSAMASCTGAFAKHGGCSQSSAWSALSCFERNTSCVSAHCVIEQMVPSKIVEPTPNKCIDDNVQTNREQQREDVIALESKAALTFINDFYNDFYQNK